MKNQKGSALVVLVIYICIALAALTGWVMNIIDLINSSFDPITGMVVARVIGIFVAPLGAVLGYF